MVIPLRRSSRPAVNKAQVEDSYVEGQPLSLRGSRKQKPRTFDLTGERTPTTTPRSGALPASASALSGRRAFPVPAHLPESGLCSGDEDENEQEQEESQQQA